MSNRADGAAGARRCWLVDRPGVWLRKRLLRMWLADALRQSKSIASAESGIERVR